MNRIASLLLSVAFILIGCSPRCKCHFDEAISKSHDSLVCHTMINNQANANAYLEKLDEPALFNRGVESYRIIVTSSTGESISCIRLDKKNGQYYLTDKCFKRELLKNSSGYGKLISVRNRTFGISTHHAKRITNAFEEECFWSIPATEVNHIEDAAIITMEAEKPNNVCQRPAYHLVIRNDLFTTEITPIHDQFALVSTKY